MVKDILIYSTTILPLMLFLRFFHFVLFPPLIIIYDSLCFIVLLFGNMTRGIDQMRKFFQGVSILLMRNSL